MFASVLVKIVSTQVAEYAKVARVYLHLSSGAGCSVDCHLKPVVGGHCGIVLARERANEGDRRTRKGADSIGTTG